MADLSPPRRSEHQEVSEELPEAFKDQRVRHRDFKRRGQSSGRSNSIPLSAEELEAVRSSLSSRFDNALPTTEQTAGQTAQNATEQAGQSTTGQAVQSTTVQTAGLTATNNSSTVQAIWLVQQQQQQQQQQQPQASQDSQAPQSVQQALNTEGTNPPIQDGWSNGGSAGRPTRAGTHARRSRSVGAISSIKTRTASRLAKGSIVERVTRRRFSKRRAADSLGGKKVELKEVAVTGRQTRGTRGAASVSIGTGRRSASSTRGLAIATAARTAATTAVARQASPGSQGKSHEP